MCPSRGKINKCQGIQNEKRQTFNLLQDFIYDDEPRRPNNKEQILNAGVDIKELFKRINALLREFAERHGDGE